MLGIIAVVIVLVAAVLALAASRPASFRLSRSILVAAPAERIMPLIQDFHRWEQWSPYEGVEGDELVKTFEGAPAGKGAIYGWTGRKTGQGRMEITEAAASRVLIDLKFLKPMQADNVAEFALAPEGQGTRVTWSMEGRNSFMAKLMGLVFNMEKMVGPQFDQGLAKLKAAAES